MTSCAEQTSHEKKMQSHTYFRKKCHNQKYLLIKSTCYKKKLLLTRRAVIGQIKGIESFVKELAITGTHRRITCKGSVKLSVQKRIWFIKACKVFLSNSNGLCFWQHSVILVTKGKSLLFISIMNKHLRSKNTKYFFQDKMQ